MKILLKNVTKIYKQRKPRCPFIGGLFGIAETKTALSGIDLEIHSGECVGIIGPNGSGKSTLLKLICSVTSPTEGSVITEGKISALLELGTSFNAEYSGISNIYLNGAIQGLSKKQIKAMLPDIIRFADIGESIYNPVKTYSDGMFLRLAFACAVATSPDILVVDEALAVGDFLFRQKCFARIKALKESGTTVIMVSHDIDTIRSFCDRVIWLDGGKIRQDGDVVSVSSLYMQEMTGCAELDLPSGQGSTLFCSNRFGSAIGSVQSVSVAGLQRTGEEAKILCTLNLPEGARAETLAVSFSVKNAFGLDITVISTADNDFSFSDSDLGKTITIEVKYICALCRGKYSLCVSLEDRGTVPIKYYEYAENIAAFEVASDRDYFGVFHNKSEIKLLKGGESSAKKQG